MAPSTLRYPGSGLDRAGVVPVVSINCVKNRMHGGAGVWSLRHVHRHAYDGSEASKLVAEASQTRYGPLVIVAFTTGLRRGGLAGLQWHDIDFDRATATIGRAVVKLPKAKATVKSTKTGSTATVALSEAAIDALRRQRVIQA